VEGYIIAFLKKPPRIFRSVFGGMLIERAMRSSSQHFPRWLHPFYHPFIVIPGRYPLGIMGEKIMLVFAFDSALGVGKFWM